MYLYPEFFPAQLRSTLEATLLKQVGEENPSPAATRVSKIRSFSYLLKEFLVPLGFFSEFCHGKLARA
jgi:hypothetical protein